MRLDNEVNIVKIGDYFYLVKHTLHKWIKISSLGEQIIKRVIDKGFENESESTEVNGFIDYLIEEGYLVDSDNKYCEASFFEFHIYPSNDEQDCDKLKKKIFEISAANEMCIICHCSLNNICGAISFFNETNCKHSCILLEISEEDLSMSVEHIGELLAPVYNTSIRVVLKCDDKVNICNSKDKRLIENIVLSLYNNLNTDISIHMCVNNKNYRYVTDYIQLASELFIDFTWEFEFCKSMLNKKSVISIGEEYEFVRNALSSFNKTYADEYPWGHYLLNCNQTYKNCNYPINRVSFDSNGHMYPCEFYIGISGCEIEWDADQHILKSKFECCQNVQCSCIYNDFCKYKSVKTEGICKAQKFLFDYRLVKFDELQSVDSMLESLEVHYEENK